MPDSAFFAALDNLAAPDDGASHAQAILCSRMEGVSVRRTLIVAAQLRARGPWSSRGAYPVTVDNFWRVSGAPTVILGLLSCDRSGFVREKAVRALANRPEALPWRRACP